MLWLPLVCAGFLDYLFTSMQKAASHNIVLMLRTSHSALGGDFPNTHLDHSAYRGLTFLTAPLLWGRYFSVIALYTVAFVVTAASVRAILDGGNLSMTAAVEIVRRSQRRILLFALSLLVAFGVFAILTSIIFLFPLGPAIFEFVGAPVYGAWSRFWSLHASHGSRSLSRSSLSGASMSSPFPQRSGELFGSLQFWLSRPLTPSACSLSMREFLSTRRQG